MFSKDFLTKFRKAPKKDESIPDEIKNAWILFCQDFLPCVNSNWRKVTKLLVNNQKKDFSELVTPSDEALILWIIDCCYEEIQENVKDGVFLPERKRKASKIDNSYGESEKNKRDKISGSHHDIIDKINIYLEYYTQVLNGRKIPQNEALWNHYYWNAAFSPRCQINKSKKHAMAQIKYDWV